MPPKKAPSISDGTKDKTAKDKNAPKAPPNSYSIFYKHFHSEYQKKNPRSSLSGQQVTQLVAQAWNSLSAEEKKPFQDFARIEKDKYAAKLEAYKKTDQYKQFIAHNKALTKLANVDVFSKEFIAYNKSRESELRNLRRQISAVDEQIHDKNEQIDELKAKLDRSYKSLSSTKRLSFEKERQFLIWCREIVCVLDKEGMLEELEIDYNTPAERIVEVIDKAADDPKLGAKIKKLFNGFVLEIF